MAVVLRVLFDETTALLALLRDYVDPRAADLPLVQRPGAVVAILAVYLVFVLRLGPRLMQHRPPFQLDRLMLVYNALQVVCCGYVALACWRLGWNGKYNYLCQPISRTMEPEDFNEASTAWWYFALKILDLFDTVFMILRKKASQISFLHVYHHTGMVVLIWFGLRLYPGGHHTFICVLNSIVHCVLYTYYFVSLYDSSAKMAWWKKYITLMQITQFGLVFLHELIPVFMPSCEVDKRISGVLLGQNVFMFILFTDFYIKAYVRKDSRSHKKTT